jgi:hypothetical protein
MRTADGAPWPLASSPERACWAAQADERYLQQNGPDHHCAAPWPASEAPSRLSNQPAHPGGTSMKPFECPRCWPHSLTCHLASERAATRSPQESGASAPEGQIHWDAKNTVSWPFRFTGFHDNKL